MTTHPGIRSARAAAIAAALSTTLFAPSQATPLAMSYRITPVDAGLYRYDFTLMLDDHDHSWAAGMNFNWIVFGDGPRATTLPDFVGDVASLLGSPFSGFTTSGGGNNGPTLLARTPDIQHGGWIPDAVGDSFGWSGTSANYVGRGHMRFSNAAGSPYSPAIYEVATLLPVPQVSSAALLAAGLAAVAAAVSAGRRRPDATPGAAQAA